jgi:hypothetical protein
MAQERTRYQESVIRRYYRNLDAMRAQRLQELVGDIFLATTEKKRATLWTKAGELLAATGLPAPDVQALVAARDIETLAAVVNERAGS